MWSAAVLGCVSHLSLRKNLECKTQTVLCNGVAAQRRRAAFNCIMSDLSFLQAFTFVVQRENKALLGARLDKTILIRKVMA
jgi:hypothetical protein